MCVLGRSLTEKNTLLKSKSFNFLKMKKIEWFIPFVNPPKRRLTVCNGVRMVQPLPMSLRDMVERYVRTGDVSEFQSHSVYYDDEFLEPRNFDLSDITEAEQVLASASEAKKGRRKGNVDAPSEAKAGDVPSASANSEPKASDSESKTSNGGEKL